MGRSIIKIELQPYERMELERRIKARTVSKQNHLRAEIILRRAAGEKQNDVVASLHTSRACVVKWTKRFMQDRLDGLVDKLGRGRKPSIATDKIKIIIDEATQPPPGETRWSVRTMAKKAGVSHSTVNRVWKKNDIKPHLTKTFKISKDPKFEEKFWDIIGLYLNPPDKALVLCCDEKSQCQALERTQPGLPLGAGHIKTKTHDYYRNGTTTLFAALDYISGSIIKRCEDKHTHFEWLRFLKQIERETPKDVDIHIIADNYSTHKHIKVKDWLDRHKRIKMHFTPTGSSWMNMVERFFSEITTKVIRDGSFKSVRQLISSINMYIDNRENKPYVWRADGAEILRKINRAKEVLSNAN